MMSLDNTQVDIQRSAAYEFFVVAHAAHTGKSADEIEAEITPEALETKLRTLHTHYMKREMTLVKFADLLQVSISQCSSILDASGLALRHARPRFCNL